MNAKNQSFEGIEAVAVGTVGRCVTEEYFRSFNENQFEQTAALFGEKGELVPPFESPIVGKQAILAYLEREAGNITAFPERWEMIEGGRNTPQALSGDRSQTPQIPQIIVTGKVNAIVFNVNVAWHFILTANDGTSALSQIERVRIKLLASPAELLGMKSAGN